MKERTLVLIKPDGIELKIEQKIINEILSIGDVTLVKSKRITPTIDQIGAHRSSGRSATYYGVRLEDMVGYFSSGEILALVFEGDNAVKRIRTKCGQKTNPKECDPQSIRFKYGKSLSGESIEESRCMRNIVHSSSSTKAAEYEIRVWLGGDL